MSNHQETSRAPVIEFQDPAELRMHPLHKILPGPVVDSAEWHAFVDNAAAVGPEGLPPVYVTAEGLIMDGERRWKAAKQLQWTGLACIVRHEWEAPLLIVESLMGQRALTKGAKVYLCLPMLDEYRKSAEMRRLAALKRGQNLQNGLNSPLARSVRSRKASEELAERLGVGKSLVEQAVQIRKVFELPALREHKFGFQDGSQKTLKEHFEPKILDSEEPMGLGEVLKGIGWFVEENGKPKEQAPPARNSHLFYWERAWSGWAKQCGRWGALDTVERMAATNAVKDAARQVPDEVLDVLGDVASEEKKRRRKAQGRKEQKETERTESKIA